MLSKDLLCFVLTVFFCVWCSDAASDRSGCGAVREFFTSKNITDLQQELSDDAVGPSCGGACCSEHTEVLLRARVRHDLRALAAHGGHALRGLLDNTAQTLHRHVLDLSTQFENKTRHLLAQVYRRMAANADDSVDVFYTSILTYIDTTRYPDLGSQPPVDIERVTSEFFTNLFPLAYHGAINLQKMDLSEDYKSCLRQSMDEVQPFGDIPRQIGRALLKSLRATRVLIQALYLGSHVLNVTDGLLTEDAKSPTQDACLAALLKMSYCPRCRGLGPSVKPCAGYCINVVRGCLSRGSAELDLPWSSFVAALERLVTVSRSYETGLSAEAAMRNLDTRVSEAIMYAMKNGKDLENKVKRLCGQPALVESDHGRDTPLMKGAARSVAPPPPDTEVLHFLASVAKSRGFFVNLADTICQDESFAEQNDGAECWNGERVGEYTKTIAGSGASFQKYNPEVAVSESVVDPRIAQLADQLRRATQLLNTQSASVISSESYSFMQGDEAGAEGSGSGRDYSDSEEDTYDLAGSGSGEGIDDNENSIRTEVIVPPPIQTTNKKTASSASSVHKSWISVICQLIVLDLLRRTVL